MINDLMIREFIEKIRNVFRNIPMPRRVYAEAIHCCICFILGITLTMVYNTFTENKNLSGNDEVNNSTAINRIFETNVEDTMYTPMVGFKNKDKEEKQILPSDGIILKNFQKYQERVNTESSVGNITKNIIKSNMKQTKADFLQVMKVIPSPTKTEKLIVSTEIVPEPISAPIIEPVVTEAVDKSLEVETSQPVTTNYCHEITYSIDSNIFSSSGLTADQINKLIEGKAFYGIGQDVYDIEQLYGVNAYFTLGVSSLESGYGTSAMATNQNNLFGMIGCSYDSWTDNIHAFGKLMVKYRDQWGITDPTVKNINKLYCGTDHWQDSVSSLMNTYAKSANNPI